ncbi:GumC family protein [Rhodovulum kholense]|uniref:Polysaccharide chain length determinant protein (PEP-CTERM system associated) n=1 Tax=Rhodovulum kholense TaxID=453584 RepID=A0A8E2VIP5_9RHOB|nr:chain length-determining protein [Rhodovulum kholense]PTW44024.1 polysaccharide chain length determinant protein (PEP-CTERM system associated) [Rhodovulum kholense]
MNIDLQLYWRLFLRRLPVMLVFIVLGAAAGIVAALRMPETYSTSARLLVEAPQIPDSMVSSMVQTDAVEQLDIIEQRLMTRANMIDIANRFKVYPNIRQMEPDEVVAAMRSATRIRRSAGRNQATLMTISFSSEYPQVAANVVNEYVTLVLQTNAEFRQSRAENTLQFFEQEVDRLGQELDRQSAAIASFKSQNAEALPDDQTYRMGRQNLLQERLAGLMRDLKAGQAQRADVVRIFEATGRVQQGAVQTRRSPEEERLIAARAELDNAKAIYSETSPRVISLQAIVDRLEKVVTAQQEDGTGTAGAGDVSPEQAMLDATLSEIDSRLKTLQEEIDGTNSELDQLQKAISQSAANGIQLAALERDYEIIQTRYNAAVSNLNQARMSERIESTSKGQRISVIENASVPQLPSGPGRTKVMALGGGAGLGLAGAYFVLLELLNRTIRSPAELSNRFNITPITTIPYMKPPKDRTTRRQRRARAASSAGRQVPSDGVMPG